MHDKGYSRLSGVSARVENRGGTRRVMRSTRWLRAALVTAIALGVVAGSGITASALSSALERALETRKYVYIQSSRKDGSFGSPAEIWFMLHDGAVWVASDKSSWRARRIRWGRPKARIAVGSKAGPGFMATGSFVADPKLYEEMFRVYARKYPREWPRWEPKFRGGLADHSRVLIKYVPQD